MRRRKSTGLGELSAADVWTSPEAWAANAVGEVTAVQWALIAGRKVRPPFLAWAILLLWGALVIGFGVVAGTASDRTGDLPEGQVPAMLAAMGLMVVVTVWYPVPLALMAGWSRWRARRLRRGRIAALRSCRIADALGEISDVARVGQSSIHVPEGAPQLPPPGAYRLYWLEPTRRGGTPLLLSAEPVDVQEAAGSMYPTCAQLAWMGRVLAGELGVTPQQLTANRAGRLTRRQRRALIRRVRLRLLLPGVLIYAVVFAAVGFLAFWCVLSLARTEWKAAVGALFALGVHGIAFAPPFLIGAWELTATSGLPAAIRALRSPAPVERVEGEVAVRLHDRKCEISAGPVRLPVSPMLGSCLLAPGRYALYYLPRLNLLLSAEHTKVVGDTAPASPAADAKE
ncbi:hypothetical protein [Streptomyces sp. GESEQ-35]|uniref:hypothetical protein n=1 Tax=Streptomyces sp. GESEQ-35 TaxID=2812657 RepID=UPI001B33BBCA|nr:hypothetical protein [Streptomyces sp. GESEQ-35]